MPRKKRGWGEDSRKNLTELLTGIWEIEAFFIKTKMKTDYINSEKSLIYMNYNSYNLYGIQLLFRAI